MILISETPPIRNKIHSGTIDTQFILFSGSIFNGGPPPRAPAPPQQAVSANDPWQVGAPANMAQIKDLQVQCEKDMMRVRVIFDRPFYGMIFSKGHYRNANCVHVPANLGQTQVPTNQPQYLSAFFKQRLARIDLLLLKMRFEC